MEFKKLVTRVLLILLAAGMMGAFAPEPFFAMASTSHEQYLAPAIPAWQQVNSNGFGDPLVPEISALEAFKGYLYAGTHNPIDPAPLYDGAQIFRSSDGVSWTPVTQPGFGNTHDIAPPAILDFLVFNDYLYAGTGRGNASQVWRTSNGTTWAPMDVTGFSDADNVAVTVLAAYGSKIYAGVTNQVSGAQVWSSFTGDNNTWSRVAPDVLGTEPASITGMVEFDGALYAAVESATPAQIWQTYGGSWATIVSDGFGESNTTLSGGMAVFGGYLYVGAGNTTSGAQLWRTSDGTTWQKVVTPAFSDANNKQVEMVSVFENQIYLSLNNEATGVEIWRSADVVNWEQVNQDGFGDTNNTRSNSSNASTAFLGQLFFGTLNAVDGGELWRKQPEGVTPVNSITLLPLILH
jgi:hypothetical protein